MAGLVRHRQTKGSATDRLHLNHRATPRLHTNSSQYCLRSYSENLSFPASTSAKVLDSALMTFWRFGSSSRYIGSRSNQRSTSQPLSCRQSSPSSAVSALAVIRLLGLVFCS